MTIYAPFDLVAHQTAANVIAADNARISRIFGSVPTEIPPLVFYSRETEDYNSRTIDRVPFWSDQFCALSHNVLDHFGVNYGTARARDLRNNNAKKGDAIVTFGVVMNNAILEVDFAGTPVADWPVTLPISGATLYVYVGYAAEDSDESLGYLWGEASYDGLELSAEGQTFTLEPRPLNAWAKSFDLAPFLNDPRAVFAEIKAVLESIK
ncbi:MAG: hypothetical protein LBS60_02805 [Deltaproteobacteria bacterium]|jgi:hypothetical protein|nr:hypothetical protein [Deltaproteobacteria bacterium]